MNLYRCTCESRFLVFLCLLFIFYFILKVKQVTVDMTNLCTILELCVCVFELQAWMEVPVTDGQINKWSEVIA